MKSPTDVGEKESRRKKTCGEHRERKKEREETSEHRKKVERKKELQQEPRTETAFGERNFYRPSN
jgi:hypothetical protein